MEMQLEIDTLYRDDEHEYLVYVWAPADARERRVSAERDVAILGVGMHPWGKWGRDFTEYGMVAAPRRARRRRPRVARHPVRRRSPTPSATATPGFIAGATFAQKLGWTGVRVSSSYAACASGAQALHQARAQILAGYCDVALVIGADTTPKGFFAPVGGERKTDPDWLRFHLLGATNPVYFALYARRRMDVYGATTEDFARVKVKNSQHGLENPNARFRKENSVEDVVNSPVVADPLRLLDICATSDGAAALIVSSMDFAAEHARLDRRRPAREGRLHRDAALPADRARAPRLRHRLQRRGRRRPTGRSRTRSRGAAYDEAGIGPDDLEPGRGVRPLHRARARLVREHRARAARARPRRCCARAPPSSAAASR